MKKDELQKLKNKSLAELEKELADSRERLRNLIFDLASGKTKNTALIAETKKRIARILTFINSKTKESRINAAETEHQSTTR
jgi:ribosomal protein L29